MEHVTGFEERIALSAECTSRCVRLGKAQELWLMWKVEALLTMTTSRSIVERAAAAAAIRPARTSQPSRLAPPLPRILMLPARRIGSSAPFLALSIGRRCRHHSPVAPACAALPPFVVQASPTLRRCCRLGVSHPQAAGPGQLAAAHPTAADLRSTCPPLWLPPTLPAGLSRCSLQQLCAATATSAAVAKTAAAAAAASLRPAVLCLNLGGRLGLERQRVQPRGKLLFQRPVHQAVTLNGVLPLEAVRHYLHSARACKR